MSTRIWAHLALLSVAMFYAGSFVVAKLVMNGDYVGPLGLALIRIGTAAAFFWILTPLTKGEWIKRKDIGLFALCGLLGVCTNQTLFLSGLELTTPVHAALIMTTCPVMVMVFSYFIVGERITPKKIIGIAMGCAGAVVLMTAGQEVAANRAYLIGDLFIMGNATSYALYLVLAKRLAREYSPLTLVRWLFSFGFLYVLPLGYSQFAAIEWSQYDTSVWISLTYVVVCVTILAYLFNTYGLRHVNPSTVSIYIYLQPLFATILSTALAMEELNLIKIASGLFIFAGVYLVSDLNLRSRPKSGLQS